MKRMFLIGISLAIKAVLNFAGVVVYSHLLTPAEYGIYAFILTIVLVSDALMFMWLRYSFIRFHARANQSEAYHYLGHILMMYGGLATSAVLVSLAGGFTHLLPQITPLFWLLCGALIVGEGCFNVIATFSNTRRREDIFLALNVAKPLSALGLGWLLIHQGYGVTGVLVGQLLSYAIVNVSAVLLDKAWRNINFKPLKFSIFTELVRFGLPLIVVSGMEYAITAGNRTAVISFLGAEASGIYAVSNDIVQKLLVFLMLTVNTSMLPIVVAKLEQKGPDSARGQMRRNAVIMLGLAIPAAVGMAMLAPQLANVFLGKDFHAGATALIPLFTLSALPKCAMSFYVVQAFYFSKMNKLLFWPSVATLLLSLALAYVLTPWLGMQGALASIALSWIFYLACGIYLSRKTFPLPFPWKDFFSILSATALMIAAVLPLRGINGGLPGLLLCSAAGGLVYGLAVLYMNVGDSRAQLTSLKKRLLF